MKQVLVVDDEGGIRELLHEILSEEGYKVTLATNAEDARDIRKEIRPDLVLLDIWMPDTDGITLLKEWGARGQLTMPVIMMSGHGTIDTAVEATRIGAYAFLEKPFAVRKLLTLVATALERRKQSVSQNVISLVGGSKLAQSFRGQIEKIKNNRSSVLVLAEPGIDVGEIAKEFHLHTSSWVMLTSSDFAADWENKSEAIEEGSIVYIDKVHLLKSSHQKLLKKYLKKIETENLRIIASATNNLTDSMADRSFDPDLYFLLAGVILTAPNLRSRPEDIPEIANLILEREIETRDVVIKGFTTAALNALRNHHWPGNIAQLEVVIRTSVQLASGDLIDLGDINGVIADTSRSKSHIQTTFPFDLSLREARDLFERMYFEYHLTNEKGSISKVSASTGIERTHLYRKLKTLGIKVTRKPPK